MLETLDNIEWNQLSHAYGPAQDVPELLRALLSEETTVREEAFRGLFSTIWHQGTVYEATAHAVPFLLELLESAQSYEKPQILVLLQCIATGSSYLEVHEPYDRVPEKYRDEEFLSKAEQERRWVRAARAAVGDGTPLYERLLEHPNADTRAAAAHALSSFPEQAGVTLSALLARLQKERNSKVKASLLQSISALTGTGSAYRMLFENAARFETNPMVRTVAAMALARISPHSLLPEAVEMLVQAVPYPNPLDDLYAALPSSDGDICQEAHKALRSLRGEAARHAVPRLRALLPTTRETYIPPLVATLMELTFGEPDAQNPIHIAALTTEQEEILSEIVEADACWPPTRRQHPDVPDYLRDYGLPDTRQALMAALAAR